MNRKAKNSRYSSRVSDRKSGRRDFKDSDPKSTKNTKMCANDPEWYIRNGQLAKDVASLSFNTAIGVATTIDPDFGSAIAGLQGVKFTAPGMMAIHTIAAPGFSSSATSPINIAAKNLYSYIRHANSGHSNYDSPDLMLYFLAMDSAFNLIYHLQRVLGVSTLFSQKNRYIGDALITAMGINASDLRQNLAQYRARLNMAIVKASVFAVPNVFTLFKRHSWMYSNMFADNPVDKAQLYFYVPSIVHKYVETDGAGHLDPVEVFVSGSSGALATATINFGTAVNTLDTLLGALQASEDINIMSGDILKAYGKENLYVLGLIPEDFVIAPIYSEEILDQIHNTRFAGCNPRKASIAGSDPTTYSLDSLAIKQDPSIGAGNLLFQPAFAGAQHLSYEPIIDMSENEPTPERVLVATRNTIGGYTMKTTTANVWLTYLTSFASDIPLFGALYHINEETGTLTANRCYLSSVSGIVDTAYPYLRMFNKAPIIYTGVVDTDAHTYTLSLPNGDIENYTIIGETTLDKMHQSAILSMLGVPV